MCDFDCSSPGSPTSTSTSTSTFSSTPTTSTATVNSNTNFNSTTSVTVVINSPTGENIKGSNPQFMQRAKIAISMIAESTASICVVMGVLAAIIIKCLSLKKKMKAALAADPPTVNRVREEEVTVEIADDSERWESGEEDFCLFNWTSLC